jgi:phosphatidate phosphatase APP1
MLRRTVVLLGLASALALSAPRPAEAKPTDAVVVVYDDIGTREGGLRVRGHVVVDKGFEVAGGTIGGPFATLRTIWKNLQLVRGAPVRSPRLEVVVDGRTFRVNGDARGRFELRIGDQVGLTPGRYAVEARLLDHGRAARTLPGTLSVLSEAGGRILVSDIDDTVLESAVTSRLMFYWRALTTRSDTQEAVHGAAAAYRSLDATGVPTAFVSLTPSTLYPKLRAFFAAHGFPVAALYMRNRPEDFATSKEAYKADRIATIESLAPRHDLILVGDSGQRDPEAYALATARAPERVAGRFIRLVTDEPRTSRRFAGTRTFVGGYDARLVKRLRGSGLRTGASPSRTMRIGRR